MRILIWRIGEFFTESPKLIPPNTRACDYVRHAHARNSAQRGRVRHTRIRQIKIR